MIKAVILYFPERVRCSSYFCRVEQVCHRVYEVAGKYIVRDTLSITKIEKTTINQDLYGLQIYHMYAVKYPRFGFCQHFIVLLSLVEYSANDNHVKRKEKI